MYISHAVINYSINSGRRVLSAMSDCIISHYARLAEFLAFSRDYSLTDSGTFTSVNCKTRIVHQLFGTVIHSQRHESPLCSLRLSCRVSTQTAQQTDTSTFTSRFTGLNRFARFLSHSFPLVNSSLSLCCWQRCAIAISGQPKMDLVSNFKRCIISYKSYL